MCVLDSRAPPCAPYRPHWCCKFRVCASKSVLSSLRHKTRRVRQVAALDPLPDRIVEQYRVLLRLPYGGQFDRAWAVQAKIEATWLPTANKNSFGHPECIDFQFIVFA